MSTKQIYPVEALSGTQEVGARVDGWKRGREERLDGSEPQTQKAQRGGPRELSAR